MEADGPPDATIDHGKAIIALDVDCFYAQVETQRNPALAGRPVGIQQKYLIVTCNYEARAQGVTKLQSLVEARRRCPSLVVLNGEDLTHYRDASERIHSFIRERFPLAQRLGMDENFIDVTAAANERVLRAGGGGGGGGGGSSSSSSCGGGARGVDAAFDGHVYSGEGGALVETQTGTAIAIVRSGSSSSGSSSGGSGGGSGSSSRDVANGGSSSDASDGACGCGCTARLAAASQLAGELRRALREEVGYTTCAGIACNKLAAKLAAELHKPNQQTTLLPHLVPSIVAALPLRKLTGCGGATTRAVEDALGVTTAAQLQAVPWPLLAAKMGAKMAAVLYRLCRGADATAAAAEVVASGPPRTMSDEDTYKAGTVTSRGEVRRRLAELAAPLLRRAGQRRRQAGEVPQTLRVSVRRRGASNANNWGRESRQGPVPAGVVGPFAAASGAATAAAGVVAAEAGPAAASAADVAAAAAPTGDEALNARQEAAVTALVSAALALFDRIAAPGTAFDLALINLCFASFVSDGAASQATISGFFRRKGETEAETGPASPTGGGKLLASLSADSSTSARVGVGGGGNLPDSSPVEAEIGNPVAAATADEAAAAMESAAESATECEAEAALLSTESTAAGGKAVQATPPPQQRPPPPRPPPQASSPGLDGTVDREFLMALPPDLRAEVMAGMQQSRKRAKKGPGADIRRFFGTPA